MKNLLFMFYCLITLSSITRAQELDVFSINTSQFPTIRAHYYAFDTNKKPLQNLTPADFLIYENGIQRVISTISPPKQGSPEKVSVAVGIDCSSSMTEMDGTFDMPIDLSKRMTTHFINALSLPANEASLQTCNDQPLIAVDFTRNSQRFLDALDPILADGSNNMSEQLLHTTAGLLNITKEGSYKKIAVLCTDGKARELSWADIKKCKDTCTKYGIRFFAILFAREESEPNGIKVSLRELAEATGGRVFDGVTEQKDAENIADKLQSMISYGDPHIIEWVSENSCVQEKNVIISIVPTGAESRVVYDAPESSLARLVTVPETIIDVGAIVPGQVKDTTFTITARNATFLISEIIPSSPTFNIIDYGGSAPPFTLLKDESRVLTIRFAPVDSGRTYEKITFQNNLCTPHHSFVVGGFPGHPSSPLLELTQPAENDVLVAGSSSNITWEGIPTGETVALDYSTNNGQSWSMITNNATGLLQEWRVPRTQSNECLMRVQSKAQENNTSWARVIENVGSNGATNITADRDGNVFICGFLGGAETDFGGGFTLPGPDDYNKRDMFIAKYNRTGTIQWAKKITAGKVEIDQSSSPSGIQTDKFGNVYICGFFQSSFLDFGNGVKISQAVVENNYDSFLAKYDTDGNPQWAKSIGGYSTDLIQDMSFDNAGNIYLGGHAWSTEITVANTLKVTSPTKDNAVLIKFSPEGKPLWGKLTGSNGAEVITSVTCDSYDNALVAGFYYQTDFKLENGDVLKNTGKINPFILKYSADGKLLWGKKPTQSSNEMLIQIRVDKNDAIYVAGESEQHSIAFNNGLLLEDADTSKRLSHFVAKYDSEGELEWAHLAPFINDMFFDKSTETMITAGTYFGKADFGTGISFDDTDKHYSPGFVAFYNSDGTVRQAIKVESGHNTIPNSVFCDETGKVYLCGHKSGKGLEFDHYTEEQDKSAGMFVAKLAVRPDPDQTDISDGIFSIVIPQAESQDVHVGAMIVGSTRDTLVNSFIRNTGSYPIRIDAINFNGPHASDFQITSGLPPFTLGAGEEAALEFRFIPEDVGDRSATIEIITQCDTIFQSIAGVGVENSIQVSSDLDFGRVSFGSSHDSIADISIKNNRTSPLIITKVSMTGEAASQFEITEGAEGVHVAPGGHHTVKLQFRPQYTGRINGRLDISYLGMMRPISVRLSGKSVGTNVFVHNDSAARGDIATLRLMLSETSLSRVPGNAAILSARLAFSTNEIKADVSRFPDMTAVRSGKGVDTIDIQTDWKQGALSLAKIPVYVATDLRSMTEIHLLEFDWLDKNGEMIDYTAERTSGVFITVASQERPKQKRGQFSMFPHPVRNQINVQFAAIEHGTTMFYLTDIQGKQIVLHQGEYTIGDHTIVLNTGSVAPGVYQLTMQTPTLLFTNSIIVQ